MMKLPIQAVPVKRTIPTTTISNETDIASISNVPGVEASFVWDLLKTIGQVVGQIAKNI
jgi:hypothetical protein